MILRFLTTVFGLIAVVLTAVIGIALLTSVDENKFGGATNVSVESAPVELGEAALVGDVEFTLNGAEVRESVGGLFFSQSAQKNEVFLAIRYTYRNVGSSPISSWSKPRIRLVDGYGTEYSSDVGVSSRYATEIDVNINVFSDINPGVSQSGGDVFVLGRDYFHSNDWKLKVSQGGRQALFSLTRNDNVFIEEKSSTDPIDEVLGVVSQVFGETVSSSSELLIEVPGADDLSADASRRDDFSSDEVVAKVQVVGIDYGDDLKVWSEPLSLLPPVGSVPNRNAEQIRQQSSDRDARPIRPPAPSYPQRAAELRISGSCDVRFDVDTRGTPYNIVATCTDSIFKSEAERAVSRAEFAPKIVRGEAVERRNLVYPLEFKISE